MNLNDKHWWRDHGFLCYTVCNHGNGGGGGGGDANSDDIDGGGSGGNLAAVLDQFFLGETDMSVNNDSDSEIVGIQKCFASYVVSACMVTVNPPFYQLLL